MLLETTFLGNHVLGNCLNDYNNMVVCLIEIMIILLD